MTLCRDESVLLNGMMNFNDPNLPVSYSWSPANLVDNPNIMNPEAFPEATTVYNLIVESGDCILRDSVTVSVCLLYTSPSPRDATLSRMPSSA